MITRTEYSVGCVSKLDRISDQKPDLRNIDRAVVDNNCICTSKNNNKSNAHQSNSGDVSSTIIKNLKKKLKTTKRIYNYDRNVEHNHCCESTFSFNCHCQRTPCGSILLVFCFLYCCVNVSLLVHVNTQFIDSLLLFPLSPTEQTQQQQHKRSQFTLSSVSTYHFDDEYNSNGYDSRNIPVQMENFSSSTEQSQRLRRVQQIEANPNPDSSSLIITENIGVPPVVSFGDDSSTRTTTKPIVDQDRPTFKSNMLIKDDNIFSGTSSFNMNEEHDTIDGNSSDYEQVELPILPNPVSLLPNATFSACLLIKDDNALLNEWIAYHYHTVNLRQLIVAVDPTSSESPSLILQKWRTLTKQMAANATLPLSTSNTTSTSTNVPIELVIQEWYDTDYMPTEFLESGRAPILQTASDLTNIADINNPNLSNETVLLEISNHRYRQRVFLAQCLQKYRAMSHSQSHHHRPITWVTHIDTDEYIVASKLLRQMNPDYVKIPNTTVAGSVLNLIQQTVSQSYQLVGYPCISMLRVLFGSVESITESERNDALYLPSQLFNSTKFETLRWRYHALPHNMSMHGNPKVILDVSAIPSHYFPKTAVYSIHRPVQEVCRKNKELEFSNYRKQPIATNHYLGSWERYSSRRDQRRSRSVYNRKAKVRRGKDDYTKSWLKGFVQKHGHDIASQLLGPHYLNK